MWWRKSSMCLCAVHRGENVLQQRSLRAGDVVLVEAWPRCSGYFVVCSGKRGGALPVIKAS